MNFGIIRFQPSEMMKLAVPMMLAWYLSAKKLPPRVPDVLAASVLLLVPTLLIAEQPDLGTGLLIAASGLFVLFLSGIHYRFIIVATLALSAAFLT